MGHSITRKFIAVLVILTMVLASCSLAFAATKSPGSGSDEPATKPGVAKITSFTTYGSFANRSLTASYRANKAAKKFQVAIRRAGGSWTTKTTTRKAYTFGGLTARGLYELKVRGINSAGTKGSYSTVRYRYLGVAGVTVTSPKRGQIRVKATAAGANRFVISYSFHSDMSYSKTLTVTGNGGCTQNISINRPGKTYYVTVRSSAVKNGHTYVGFNSNVKSCKTVR